MHGFPECWYSWRHQLVALSDRYTVVAPDLRGYNLSDRPEGKDQYTVDKLADDVIGLIRHLGHEKATVVGHDWGAGIAWYIASHHPEYLTKVAAFQVPPSIWRRNFSFKQLLASWYMFFFQLPLLPEKLLSLGEFALLKRALKASTAESGVFRSVDIEIFESAWRGDGAITAMLNYYRANIISRLFSKEDEAARVAVPTLFVYGQQDTAVLPQTVRGVADVVDGPYENYLVPNSGHWIQQEVPETVNEILREFLTDQTKG
ncbi:MAG: alpha/beta hydrolase [Pyrinomonadaceae bacterium]|nr:alpha/beta hydrolase [Pyrinomonadaceae bacterium]